MIAPTLENERVKLSLLDLSNYKNLIEIASQDNLIQYSPSDISTPEKLKAYVQVAVDGYYHKTIIPIIIFDKQTQTYAGSTRFGLINWKNKVLHIGWTWIGKQFQGTGLNTHMKFLMLQYAFETLEFDKVEFRIDERNTASRKAVEKLNAKLEGILRKDTLMRDGFKRSTCCYGILKDEWPEIKATIFKGF
ncbi:GNAT family N-acetyltransferase [Flavobacteriaceae bacterium S0825]|uniref:GNAT family N-acetyltransferase n=1 Tax=Gaetbulibacter sp. S0825 TaxID=2720084 RepID=UPI0014317EDF|nr:GNAT family protein [Gaetbulibacter sp. S0825]MCK0109578.1 GNAT family N-acetyltransferase [Flavobacteriaceae bacterium S0825]NIX65211.1 GNAT family N-acetyltransferase [Gaetbulibacter sp. S0825]